jgi:hypothetical protein
VEENGLKAKHNREGKSELMGQQKWHMIFDAFKWLSCVVCHTSNLLEKFYVRDTARHLISVV